MRHMTLFFLVPVAIIAGLLGCKPRNNVSAPDARTKSFTLDESEAEIAMLPVVSRGIFDAITDDTGRQILAGSPDMSEVGAGLLRCDDGESRRLALLKASRASFVVFDPNDSSVVVEDASCTVMHAFKLQAVYDALSAMALSTTTATDTKAEQAVYSEATDTEAEKAVYSEATNTEAEQAVYLAIRGEHLADVERHRLTPLIKALNMAVLKPGELETTFAEKLSNLDQRFNPCVTHTDQTSFSCRKHPASSDASTFRYSGSQDPDALLTAMAGVISGPSLGLTDWDFLGFDKRVKRGLSGGSAPKVRRKYTVYYDKAVIDAHGESASVRLWGEGEFRHDKGKTPTPDNLEGVEWDEDWTYSAWTWYSYWDGKYSVTSDLYETSVAVDAGRDAPENLPDGYFEPLAGHEVFIYTIKKCDGQKMYAIGLADYNLREDTVSDLKWLKPAEALARTAAQTAEQAWASDYNWAVDAAMKNKKGSSYGRDGAFYVSPKLVPPRLQCAE